MFSFKSHESHDDIVYLAEELLTHRTEPGILVIVKQSCSHLCIIPP